jgi:MoxR-like ATPase
METTRTPLDPKAYPHDVKPEFLGQGAANYFADDKLRMAVNLAVALGRPLLVHGEPGIGKTRLATAVAEELTEGRILEWRIKSSERVRDGLYHYDPIRRLIDTQLAPTSPEHRLQAQNPYHYVRFSYLGKAIIDPKPVVLLIDEIDKADMDFPNDLLRELDDLWFEVTEVPLGTGEIDLKAFTKRQRGMSEAEILKSATLSPEAAEDFAIISGQGKPRPIIIITSNDEKPLPPAFLRRCIVHRIEFPDLNHKDSNIRRENRQRLLAIIQANMTSRLNLTDLNEVIVLRVLDVFAEVRKHARQLSKPPAIAELVEWMVALYHPSFSDRLDELVGGRPLPFWRVMFKSFEDQHYIATELPDGMLQVER